MGLKQYNNIVSNESLISTEYNKVDWWRLFFSGFNQLYRLISNADKTRIEQPGLLLNIFLGKMTTFANIAMHVNDSLSNVAGAPTGVVMSIWSVWTGGLKYNHNKGNNSAFFDKLKQIKNPYYYIISNQMSGINVSDEATYKEWENNVKQFEELIDLAIEKICVPIPERPMQLGEKNLLALYDPEKFSNEVKNSLSVIDMKLQNIGNDALAKKWQDLVQRLVECSKKAFNHIGKNISI
jgi:hypothetical protein